MGTFSSLLRFREAGQDANVNNVERFGIPSRSLFTSTKVFTIHHKIEMVGTVYRRFGQICHVPWVYFIRLQFQQLAGSEA